ncbi:STAS domain-containing protein [Vibrio sp. 10N.261.55.A7]|uniref:STAS domain-containing protein n=1 Tax=Vibrio sp. 10N.261.55.A7 TaxID=1880851 RepID=UPI000C82F605|nr:STAS domain-containing protein [Vibrio sp. 10N.261.55.A7]PMK05138.1 hypothetical protein BCU12_00245 [Vibrio sp. 10N.261.55.A7]
MSAKVYLLPQELTIYEVGDVHRELIAIIESDHLVQLDASEVEELDTAGFQLLLWFSKFSKHYHKFPPFSSLSPSVSDYIQMLHLENDLYSGDIEPLGETS